MKINDLTESKLEDLIEKRINYKQVDVSPEASVIIVTYNTGRHLLSKNLESLKLQTDTRFEIVIVDNSDKRDIAPIALKHKLLYIKLKKNVGPSLARNIGLRVAEGNIIIFLDDDAIPANDFVSQHIKAYQMNNILGLRGKAIPIADNLYNKLSVLYDLGDKIIPSPITLEGNSSFKRDILIDIGGFNSKLGDSGGHEGLELSYRIISKYKDKKLLIYYPHAVIYHDNKDTLLKYIKKSINQSRNSHLISKSTPDIWKYYESYRFPTQDIGNLNITDKTKYTFLRIAKLFVEKYYTLKRKIERFFDMNI